MDLLYSFRLVVDLLWILFSACCATNPELIEQVEFGLYIARTSFWLWQRNVLQTKVDAQCDNLATVELS